MTEYGLKEKKDWLSRYQESLRKEKRLKETLREVRSRAESTAQALSGMPPAGGQRSKVESGAILLAAYTMQLNEQIVDGEVIRAEIEAAVGRLKDPLQREVLYWRYIKGEDGRPMDLWKVSNKLYISERHTRRLFHQALVNLELPEEGRSSTRPSRNCRPPLTPTLRTAKASRCWTIPAASLPINTAPAGRGAGLSRRADSDRAAGRWE